MDVRRGRIGSGVSLSKFIDWWIKCLVLSCNLGKEGY